MVHGLSAALSLVIWAGLAGGAAADSRTLADQAIQSFHDTLVRTMQTSALADREALLRPEVVRLFDFGRIAQVSLGRTWRELGEDDRDRFVGLLEELIVVTYATRFNVYNGQHFAIDGTREAGRGWVVETRLIKADGEAVELDYFFRDRRVFNVVADGVSDLSLRRADYSAIVKAQGFAALVDHIENKIRTTRSPD